MEQIVISGTGVFTPEESITNKELVKAYNKEAKSGIVGVHRQALYLTALRQEFKERLKESPVYLLEHVLGLVGPIKIVNGNIVIKESFYE